MADYSKQRIALRYWLLGAGYHRAAEAMAFAEQYHTGKRKDGVTPELAHQVAIASMVRTLVPHLTYPEESIMAAFLHDVAEDYGVSIEELRDRFGPLVAEAVDTMTKEFRGVRRDDTEVLARIAQNEISSIVKLCDRSNNLSTMVGVFTLEKAQRYLEESREILKITKARTAFVRQEPAYELLKLVLESQIDLLQVIVNVSSEAPKDPSEKVPHPRDTSSSPVS